MLSLPPSDSTAAYPQLELLPKLLNVLFKWRWLIVLCALAVALPVAVVMFMKAPQYQVGMKFLIKSSRTQMAVDLGDKSGTLVSYTVTPQVLNSEIQVLRSPELIQAAIKQTDYPLLGPDTPETPGARERALQALRGRLNVGPAADSHVIDVSMTDPNPAAAAKFLNALATLYLKKKAFLQAGGDTTMSFFEAQVAYHRERFDEARAALADFQEKDNIVAIGEEVDLNLAKLTAMESALKDLQAEIQALGKEIASLEQQVASQPDELTTQRLIVPNPEVVAMRTKLVDLERQRDELLQRYTPKSRFVQDKEAEIEVLRKALEQREQSVTGGTTVSQNRLKDVLTQTLFQKRVALQGAMAKRATVMTEKKSYEDRLNVLKDRSFELGRLRSTFDLARDNYIMYEKKAEEARVSRAMDEERIVNAALIDPASAPVLPQPRGLLIATAVSGMAGLVFGVALAFALEFFNLTIKDEKDAERFLGVPVLATVRQF
jgi:uncharacterized protein involved in exopolysaccharide biosynthesis